MKVKGFRLQTKLPVTCVGAPNRSGLAHDHVICHS